MDGPYADAAFARLRPYVIAQDCYPAPWEIVPNDGEGPACVRADNGRLLMRGPTTVCERTNLVRLVRAEMVEGVSIDALTCLIVCAIVGPGTDPNFPDLLPWVVEEKGGGRYQVRHSLHPGTVIADDLSFEHAHRLHQHAMGIYQNILPQLREPF